MKLEENFPYLNRV